MPSRTANLSLIVLLVAATLGAVIFLITPNESHSPTADTIQSPEKEKLPGAANPSEKVVPPLDSKRGDSANLEKIAAPIPPASEPSMGGSTQSPAPAVPYQPPSSKYKNARNPAARKALAGVGMDTESEQIWLEAINDPSLPANERKDLIEDLNEDGISNPAQPTDRDLTLIKSRIALIATLLPHAMDETNAAALREAQKDLANMVKRLER